MHLEYQMEIDQDAIWQLSSDAPFQSAPPFWVREAGRFNAQPGFTSSRSAKPGYTILYTIHGEGELVYSGKRHPLQAGSVAFIDCSHPHEYRAYNSGNWRFYWVHLDATNCDFYYQTMFRPGFGTLVCGEDTGLVQHFDSILRLMQSPQASSYSGISHAVSAILTQLLEANAEQQRRNTLHQNAIESTVQHIRTHYRDSIDVDFLAQMASLSKYYYIKLFKEIMHATPYEFLLGVRINEAKKLLLATDLKSAEIGTLVGFADECNFSRTFKRLAGITPIQYGKSM